MGTRKGNSGRDLNSRATNEPQLEGVNHDANRERVKNSSAVQITYKNRPAEQRGKKRCSQKETKKETKKRGQEGDDYKSEKSN